VCLPPKPSDDSEKYDNIAVDLIGWGTEARDGKSAEALKRVTLKIYSQR
jgi:hypothetical protein